jgi:hypothetical protein
MDVMLALTTNTVLGDGVAPDERRYEPSSLILANRIRAAASPSISFA